MPRQSKNFYAETAEQIRILHVLSGKDKRIRPLENLVKGLDKSMFSQVFCYLRGNDEEHTEFETLGHDVFTLNIVRIAATSPLLVMAAYTRQDFFESR